MTDWALYHAELDGVGEEGVQHRPGVGSDESQLDGRMARVEGAEDGRKEIARHGHARAEAQRAAGEAPPLGQGLLRGALFAEEDLRVRQQHLALLGQRHAARAPHQQLRPQLPFQLPHCLGDGRLTHAELPSGGGEAPLLGDRGEEPQRVEIQCHSYRLFQLLP